MIKLVSGFCPIPGHPRSQREYSELARNFGDVDGSIAVNYQDDVEELWLMKYLKWAGVKVTHSEGDNPAKNTLIYHAVQHEKLRWMVMAADQIPQPDVFAWIDYGIFHVPGVTATVISEFVQRASREKTIVIPGCWDKQLPISDALPCWRFCGGLFVVPRKFLFDLQSAFQATAIKLIRENGHVSWEVNTLARVERDYPHLPIWWYNADHNQTMFTNYPESRYEV